MTTRETYHCGGGSNLGRRALLGGAAATLAWLEQSRRARASDAVQLLSHRYPALEFYAEKLKTALPGVTVDARLMPAPQATELQRIALSSRSDAIDLMWTNDFNVAAFGKSGWLEPLDDLWAKYRKEFNLDDINPASVEACKFDGHLLALPVNTNTMVFAYRQDLFAEKGLQPPKTHAEWVEIASALNTPRRSGACLTLKTAFVQSEVTGFINVIGDGWWTPDFHPRFNSPNGAKAIDTVRQLAKYAAPGFTSNGNDESTVTLSQDIAATALQWASRCATMDDPTKSKVVGKFNWSVPPGGKQAMGTDMYAISRYSKKDKDMLFRLMASALSAANQAEAASMATPTRRAVLNDPAVTAKYRFFPMVSQALEVGLPLPVLPEFNETSEIIGNRIVQAVVGQSPVQQSLDTAAAECQDLLAKHGYYKS
jgi:ABC-type glycerol-3-phosphate transport system substrate-binding protein